MKKGYIIGQITITDPKKYQRYASETGYVKKFGCCAFEFRNILGLFGKPIASEGKTPGGDGSHPFIFHEHYGKSFTK